MISRVGPLVPAADWVVLAGGFTLMRHPPEVLASMAELAGRQIPIVVSGVFDGGFLVGSNRLDGRVARCGRSGESIIVRVANVVCRALPRAWRFAGTCVHSIRAVGAGRCCGGCSIRRIRIAWRKMWIAVLRKVPDGFWASMKEEGLLAADYPLGT